MNEDVEECGACGHSPAYHDGDGGRPCRAFTDQADDLTCACKAWQLPKPKPAPIMLDDEPNPW